jgi:hypothetical protein
MLVFKNSRRNISIIVLSNGSPQLWFLREIPEKGGVKKPGYF